MTQMTEKPCYVLKGLNHYRYIAIIILTALLILSIYSIKIIGFISLTVTFSAIFGLLNIRFPRLLLFDNQFVIEKRGILPKFNDYAEFKLTNIKAVSFSKGFTNWVQLLIQTLLGQAGYGGYSNPDRMIIKNLNDKIIVYNRFGSRKNFEKAIKEINRKSPATNTLE